LQARKFAKPETKEALNELEKRLNVLIAPNEEGNEEGGADQQDNNADRTAAEGTANNKGSATTQSKVSRLLKARAARNKKQAAAKAKGSSSNAKVCQVQSLCSSLFNLTIVFFIVVAEKK
jgi:hypothetical protein